MVQLGLSDEEATELRVALEIYLTDLRREIADTEAKDFREALQRREAVLQRVVERLGKA
jgi:hypothetical protein